MLIQAAATFKETLGLLPSIDSLARIDLVNSAGEVVGSIENQPGKQGSLAVYSYLQGEFGRLDAEAAQHGLSLFAEHTADAMNRPGAHPNIDRLLEIAAGGKPLSIVVIDV